MHSTFTEEPQDKILESSWVSLTKKLLTNMLLDHTVQGMHACCYQVSLRIGHAATAHIPFTIFSSPS
jgi:hypothetical protein